GPRLGVGASGNAPRSCRCRSARVLGETTHQTPMCRQVHPGHFATKREHSVLHVNRCPCASSLARLFDKSCTVGLGRERSSERRKPDAEETRMKPKMRLVGRWLSMPLTALALIACGDDGSGPSTTIPDSGLGECGDGIVDDNEECDDGNQVDDDECSNECTEPTCGDGIVNGDEECDEGDANSNSGACTTLCTEQRCGDGFTAATG